LEYGKIIDVCFKDKRVNLTYEYRLQLQEHEKLRTKFNEAAVLIKGLVNSKSQEAYMFRELSCILDDLRKNIK